MMILINFSIYILNIFYFILIFILCFNIEYIEYIVYIYIILSDKKELYDQKNITASCSYTCIAFTYHHSLPYIFRISFTIQQELPWC
jgi:hypothetical protein